MVRNGNTQNVTEPYIRKQFMGKFGPKAAWKWVFFDFVQNCFISFFLIFGRRIGQGCLKGGWSDFFPGKSLFAFKCGFLYHVCLPLNADFRIWGNSLLPFSCYQRFFLVFIYSYCSLPFLTLWQFIYFYQTLIIR